MAEFFEERTKLMQDFLGEAIPGQSIELGYIVYLSLLVDIVSEDEKKTRQVRTVERFKRSEYLNCHPSEGNGEEMGVLRILEESRLQSWQERPDFSHNFEWQWWRAEDITLWTISLS